MHAGFDGHAVLAFCWSSARVLLASFALGSCIAPPGMTTGARGLHLAFPSWVWAPPLGFWLGVCCSSRVSAPHLGLVVGMDGGRGVVCVIVLHCLSSLVG